MSVWSIYEDGWDGYNYEESDRDDVLLKLNAMAAGIADKMSKKYPEYVNLIYCEASAAANEYNSNIDGNPRDYIYKRVSKAVLKAKAKQQEEKAMSNKADRFKSPIPDSVKASVIADYAKGVARKELAEKYKIGASSVSRILKVAGNVAVGEEAPANRTKDTPGYKNVKSKSGTLTVHIAQDVTNRLSRFCKMQNRSQKSVVEEAVKEYLVTHEKEMLKSMTREELEQLILDGWQ